MDEHTDPADETRTDDARGGDDTDRRREPRVRVTLDAGVRRLGRSDDLVETTTVDVSHGGARLDAPRHLAIGDVVQLVVTMDHGIELTLQGLVVQVSDAGDGHHAHVAFDSLSTAAADLLAELIDEHRDWPADASEAPPAAADPA